MALYPENTQQNLLARKEEKKKMKQNPYLNCIKKNCNELQSFPLLLAYENKD